MKEKQHKVYAVISVYNRECVIEDTTENQTKALLSMCKNFIEYVNDYLDEPLTMENMLTADTDEKQVFHDSEVGFSVNPDNAYGCCNCDGEQYDIYIKEITI